MERKDFLKGAVTLSMASVLDFSTLKETIASNIPSAQSSEKDDLYAVMGGEPVAMLDKLLAEVGGIEKYVKKGDRVVLKPNAAWAKTPEMAANTNPLLVGALVKKCLDAGAKDVRVFDHTCSEWKSAYEMSGIKAAVEENGGVMLPGNDESYYVDVDFPLGVKLKKAKIHRALEECDVWFNIPVLKNHGGAIMSISMKNYMGIVWDRGFLHENDLQQSIADLCTYHKKPALHIVDAYRLMKSNGPQGKSIEDAVVTKGLFASSDPIAVDTASISFFAQVKEMDVSKVAHVGLGEKHNLGKTDLSQLNIKRYKI